jgi:hypothetical protein
MFKDTYLIALKRKDRSPHTIYLEILVRLILEVFVDLILKVFVHRLQNEFPNAQAHNHTNAVIIRICIDRKDRECDYENFGTRIT